MCLNIKKDSVVHKHLVKKLTKLNSFYTEYDECCHEYMVTHNPVIGDKKDTISNRSTHRLTMLDSFHISLEEPNPQFDHVGDSNKVRLDWFDVRAIIGEIALANIHISEKDGKKSAWIPLHPELIDDLLPHHHNHRHYARPDDPDAFDRELLHISLANLTGNPHDSIARPENCIIDTITE